MKTNRLDYDLPTELIAQEPIEPRDASKLLVLDRKSGLIEHRHFSEIECYLKPTDLLVVNDTKVLPARLKGVKQGTGAKIEVLLLSKQIATPPQGARNDEVWQVLVKPAKRLKRGDKIDFGSSLKAEVIEELEQGQRLLEFESEEPLLNILQNVGEVPLPPYITKPLLHPNRYQTIYARKQQSAAAPTAGLHFTSELIDKLKTQGIKFAHLTLAIGMDTFLPIREDEVEKHKIHKEYYEVGQEASDLINEALDNNSRIIAVGTTSARVLETLAKRSFVYTPSYAKASADKQDDKIIGHSEAKGQRISETSGYTDLFIYPGYKFKIVDSMITNFHLPRSTLLAMVGAFAGLDKIKKAYSEAIENQYRFFSFGDAMMIL